MISVKTLSAVTALLITLFFVLAGCGEEPSSGGVPPAESEQVVLTVGPNELTAGRLFPVFRQLQGDSLMVEERLESIVNRLLILEDAQDRGLDTTASYVSYAQRVRSEKLQNEWLERVLSRQVTVPEDSVLAYHGRMGQMVQYTAISLIDSAFADSLRDLVIEGADMNSFSEQFSINGFEARMRGKMGPVDLLQTRATDRELLEGLAPGEVSEIVFTQSGYRFLRLDSTYSQDPPPLEDVRIQIENFYLADLRDAYTEYLLDSLRTELELELNTDALQLVAEHFSPDSAGCIPFSEQELQMTVYSYQGGGGSLESFAEKVTHIPRVPNYQVWNADWLTEYASSLATNEIMVLKAIEAGMDTMPEIQEYLSTTLDNHLLDVYHRQVIAPRLIISEEDIEQEYESRSDTLLVEGSRIFEAISAEGEEQLQLLSDKLESGEDPFETPESFSPAVGLLAPEESLITLPIQASQVPEPFDEIIFGAELNETVTCSISTDQVLVMRPVEIIPERQATLEEVRDQLEMDLRVRMEEEVVSGLVDSLSSVYHIEIDRDYFEGFITPAATATDEARLPETIE